MEHNFILNLTIFLVLNWKKCFQGGYGTENTFENVGEVSQTTDMWCTWIQVNSAVQFEEILQSYIDAVNREPEEVDIIVFYFSGLVDDKDGEDDSDSSFKTDADDEDDDEDDEDNNDWES